MPSKQSTRTKFISPSRVARFYFHECERYLRYSSTPSAERAAEGIPSTPFDTRPVTQAILESGYAWEEEVLATRLGDRAEVAPPAEPDQPFRDRVLSAEESREVLGDLTPGRFAYQPTLTTPPGFYEEYGIDPAIVSVTDSRPDLIECYEDDEGILRLRVIDVKASPGVKLSHRIQATMYTLLIDHVLQDWGFEDRHVSPEGGIWLANTDDFEKFDIRAMRPPLETFLHEELQQIMETPAHEARWHLYHKCEWCPYFEHCREQMRERDDVSRVPYLTVHGKRYLGELDPPVSSVSQFAELLDDPSRVHLLEDAASLRGKAERLKEQASALTHGDIRPYGGSSLDMPRAEHVRIIVTVQTEPVSGLPYAYGIYGQGLKDVLGENRTIAKVARDPRPDTIERLERDLVRDLHAILAPVHEYNAQRTDDWKAQKTLQTFTFDTYERELLTAILLRRVLDPEVADPALDLFFHFQRPELVEAEDHPATEVFFPIVVLIQVLRNLFALPLEVAYRFADVVRLLQPSKFGFDYDPNDFFSFELSNQMRSDAIFGAWHRGRAEWLGSIETEIKVRLWATNSLVNGIREAADDDGSVLFAWPPKFSFPERMGFRHATLSRLAFIARYESVVSYLGVRGGRMAPLAERLRDGICLRTTYAGGDRFELDPIHRDLDIDESTFMTWILTEDSDAGTRARLAYHDYANRARVWVPKNLPLALAATRHLETSIEHPNQAVELDLKPSNAMPNLRAGQTYLLDRRYTDFTLDRVTQELTETDQDERPRFFDLIERPGEYRQRVTLPRGLAATATGLAGEHEMTPSQLQAFDGILRSNLQLVWGPPGTGKSYFLALGILCLAEAHRRAKRPFRVLVTAFTHAAIDNLLRLTARLQDRFGIVQEGLPLGKLDRSTLAEMGEVEVVPAREAGDWLDDHPIAVAGGTVWGLRKGVAPEAADVLVIDEASQLKVPESAIAIRRLAPEGRLLIAGDHRQLPPIVQAAYPDPEEGEPLLHRSIFECLAEQDIEETFTATLLENFRMNRLLCRYPAEQIYVPEYDSATPEIAIRRLALASGGETDALVDAVLDPEYPLVIGVISGVRAAAENRVEAALVATTACALRERLLDPEGDAYADTVTGDTAFWRRGLFIVSPHHAQIHAIQRALKERRAWHAVPVVDTVDKMQGQECDSVIVSYGVSDVEYAMTEKEFIYSLNRLNVSITRARAKTIVFLPKPLIEPPIAAYEDDRIAEGVAFMQGLVRFAEREGERSVHSLENLASLTLFRVAPA